MQGPAGEKAVPDEGGLSAGSSRAAASGPSTTASAVSLQGVGKEFDGTWVVRDLDLTVQPGTIFGLFGPSGSGKTTSIRLMLGLLHPDAGEVLVLGRQPRRFTARRRAEIGYMPQLFVLYPELSVEENLDLVASLYGLGWLKRRRPKEQALKFVELWDDRRKLASQLSGGMKRRLELACALMHGPRLLVVDEPTAGVDPVLRAKFWDHFRELRDAGQTIFVTSQYVTEAEYCDEIAVLGPGQLVAQGTPEAVRQSAMGGEIVEVVAEGLGRNLVDQLAALEGVRSVRRPAYDQLRLIVDQAGVRIPQVLEALRLANVEVQQVQEYRPNFDEVFVTLMEQHQAAQEPSDAV
jgi:ABC-2 type transport system ATP-binding protein